jgi:branched-chain amino acid transport system substrate-binding protein
MNNPFGQTAQKIYIDASKETDTEVVDTESFSDGETDFRTQLGKIKEKTPDILFCSAYWGEGSKILVQMQELGLDIPVIGEDGWRGPIASIVGTKALKNLYFADLSFGSEFTDNEIMQTFIKAFENKYQQKASTYSATGYDAVYIAKKAIEEGGYVGKNIKNALYKIDYTGALGHIKFDINGDDIGVQFSFFQLNMNNEAVLIK